MSYDDGKIYAIDRETLAALSRLVAWGCMCGWGTPTVAKIFTTEKDE
jgi:hypothetical protein